MDLSSTLLQSFQRTMQTRHQPLLLMRLFAATDPPDRSFDATHWWFDYAPSGVNLQSCHDVSWGVPARQNGQLGQRGQTMLSNPRALQRFQVSYATAPKRVPRRFWLGSRGTAATPKEHRCPVCELAPLHGRTGTVVVASAGRPRYHGIRLDDGLVVVVPAGNLKCGARQGHAIRLRHVRHSRTAVLVSQSHVGRP